MGRPFRARLARSSPDCTWSRRTDSPKPHWIEDVYLQRALGEVRERAGDAATAGPRGAFDALGDFYSARLPHSLVHGDLDPSNCLFEGDGLVAFLDWQDVGVGASLLDFAMTILGFCFHEVVDPNGAALLIPMPTPRCTRVTQLCVPSRTTSAPRWMPPFGMFGSRNQCGPCCIGTCTTRESPWTRRERSTAATVCTH